jgi:hypothetical protein
VRFGLELLRCEHHGHKGQQPEQRIMTDFFEQLFHRFYPVLSVAQPGRGAIIPWLADFLVPWGA